LSNEVTAADGKTLVFLIDRQVTWRHRSTQALEAHGYAVHALESYEYPLADTNGIQQPPDLVVLGCASVGYEEQQLIQRIVENRHPLLVLCSLLSSQLMRMLFLAGAKDVAIKPYDGDGLVAIVSEATATLAVSNL
jgi:DNA-binding response OmpR family regulator